MSSFLNGNNGPVCCLVEAHGWFPAREYGSKLSAKQENAWCSAFSRRHQSLAFSSAVHTRGNAFSAPYGGCKRGAAVTSITPNTPCIRTPTAGCARPRASVSLRACIAQPFEAKIWRDTARPNTSVAFHTRREKPSVLIFQKCSGQGGCGCLFAASANALRIPLSTKQLKKRSEGMSRRLCQLTFNAVV